MDRRLEVLAIAALILVVAAGCMGPMKLTRQFDDWANEFYTREPWWGQFGIIVYPIVASALSIVDFLVLNPIHFWFQGKDYNGDGTPFKHKEVAKPEGKPDVP